MLIINLPYVTHTQSCSAQRLRGICLAEKTRTRTLHLVTFANMQLPYILFPQHHTVLFSTVRNIAILLQQQTIVILSLHTYRTNHFDKH